MEQIKLTVGAVYGLNDNKNYTLKQYSQNEVVLKHLVDLKVVEKKMSMEYFLNCNPKNFGRL
jgi:hypothetical protein